MEAGLCTQLGPSHTHPVPAEAATTFGSLCRSKQVAQGQLQAASDISMLQKPSQEAPEPTHSVAIFKQHQRPSQAAHPKGDLGRPQIPLRQIPLHVVNTWTIAHTLW